jgi:hypothetical protein
MSYILGALLLLPLLFCDASFSADFCAAVPLERDVLLPPPPPPPAGLSGGPPALQAALLPYLRLCQHIYLPPPRETTMLELCLFKSARIIDEKNFSVFLGYFSHWGGGGGGGGSTLEFTGGTSWSCEGARERSLTLHITCGGSGEAPAITQWLDGGTCH